MVEGKFEKLALCAAGFASKDIIAVGSNAANVDWLPSKVRRILVAFNGDERGRQGARLLAAELTFAGVRVFDCPPPDDGQGDDCSARWRIGGHAGLRYLFDAWERIERALLCVLCADNQAVCFEGERGFCSICWPYRRLERNESTGGAGQEEVAGKSRLWSGGRVLWARWHAILCSSLPSWLVGALLSPPRSS